jgi:hypothetical protein
LGYTGCLEGELLVVDAFWLIETAVVTFALVAGMGWGLFAFALLSPCHDSTSITVVVHRSVLGFHSTEVVQLKFPQPRTPIHARRSGTINTIPVGRGSEDPSEILLPPHISLYITTPQTTPRKQTFFLF